MARARRSIGLGCYVSRAKGVLCALVMRGASPSATSYSSREREYGVGCLGWSGERSPRVTKRLDPPPLL